MVKTKKKSIQNVTYQACAEMYKTFGKRSEKEIPDLQTPNFPGSFLTEKEFSVVFQINHGTYLALLKTKDFENSFCKKDINKI